MSGLWDVHNHILPGLDDGASCLEETMEMLRQEYAQGVRHIVFTPHQRSGMFEIPEEYRIQVFEQLMEEIRGTELSEMTFQLGCEFHVHGAKYSLLQKQTYRMPSPYTSETMVLAEFSYRDDFDEVMRHLGILRDAGIRHIIIAHAERYNLSAQDIKTLHEIPGVYIQVNAGSIIGDEGLLKKMKTAKLLREDLVDLIGSDAHDTKSRVVNLRDCARYLAKLTDRATVRRIMITNPETMFAPHD